jgi:4-hydroxy-4-methyl-2-oxoglutarate aldolase
METHGNPGFRIRTSWIRPSEALLAAFGSTASSQVADSMNRLGAMDGGIRPIWASPRIIGSALTVWCHSADNLMVHKAIGMARPGDILIVNTQNNVTNSPFGELLASSALAVGIAAVIVDGSVRDGLSLERLRLPVYARALCPNGCNRDGAGEVGTTIACGGVAVRPGDVIIADGDGVTVVPLDDAAEVAKRSVSKLQQEEQRLEEIHRGVVTRPEVDDYLRRMKVIE